MPVRLTTLKILFTADKWSKNQPQILALFLTTYTQISTCQWEQLIAIGLITNSYVLLYMLSPKIHQLYIQRTNLWGHFIIISYPVDHVLYEAYIDIFIQSNTWFSGHLKTVAKCWTWIAFDYHVCDSRQLIILDVLASHLLYNLVGGWVGGSELTIENDFNFQNIYGIQPI